MKIQLRYDTAANFATANTLLDSGEVGIEDDTGLFKIGPGQWNDLAYANKVLIGASHFAVVDTLPSEPDADAVYITTN